MKIPNALGLCYGYTKALETRTKKLAGKKLLKSYNENVDLNSVCQVLQEALVEMLKTERNEKEMLFALGLFFDEKPIDAITYRTQDL